MRLNYRNTIINISQIRFHGPIDQPARARDRKLHGGCASGGCSHMPVSSMLTLARVDFAGTDPAELRAAIKLPRLIRPQPQGMSLRIGVKLASGEEEVRDFTLREIADPQDAGA